MVLFNCFCIRTHADIQPKQDSNGYVDDAERERLRADLQGRTGETDSEAEDEAVAGNEDAMGLDQEQVDTN